MSRVLDDEAKTALLDRAWQAGIRERAGFAESPAAAPPSDFLAMYYRHVPLDDLTYLPALDVYGGAMSHWQLGQVRTPGQALVRAVSPTLDESGWASPHTVIEIITDDMPYLVDSVSAELNRVDREIHLVVHPIFAVHRDADGRLSEVDGCLGDEVNETPVAELADGVLLESWIHVEIDRETDPADLSAIEERLQAVLADVRRSCEDEPEMRERALRVADELDATASAVPAVAGEVGDVVALLRWLVEDNFTFVGYRLRDTRPEEERDPDPGPDLLPLGILGSDEFRPGYAPLDRLPVEIRERSREKLLIITKASFRSTVHRNVYLDFVGVKRYDESGRVIGEHVFLGLFTSAAYTDRVRRVPVVRRKVAEVVRRSGFPASSHSSRDLMHILETFPREELFQAPVEHIERVALGVLFLQERRRVRLFARSDDYERFVSVLVYLPRDRFNTAVRYRIQDILSGVYAAETIDYRVSLSDSVLARLQFVLRMRQGTGVPEIDTLELETRVAAATRSWMDEFEDALVLQVGEEEAAALLQEQSDPMPEAYKEDFDPKTGVTDLLRVLDLSTEAGLGMSLYSPHGAPEGERRFKVFRDSPLSLAEVLPVLQRMGVEVIDERPYELRLGLGRTAYLYDFGLRYAPSGEDPSADSKQRFHDTFAAVWRDLAESDGFNALVLRAGLTWRQAALLRAYGKYLRQVGTPFSQEYLEAALESHTSIARLLVELFETRFDPAGVELRDMQAAALAAEIATGLNSVASLDQDRILRSYLHLIRATLRTNYYQVDEAGDPKPYISFKLDPQSIPDLPQPRPLFEIWVYSPRMEGVHLRFGPVARGGLRWSDRREDFRTEVLGLVKAQTVKNAVIVPAGAKGGFVVKRPPLPAADGTVDRDAVLAEGIACYQQFIRALLDVTDNLVMLDGRPELAPPPAVVRHDEDDPYLVVAADKGTAIFSDYANAVSADYGFWLGDAFASGGSAGYDHKVMGITARGAWESVRRHFRELGRDTQTEDFTVVGVGDMSGDVFGNGMLLSEHIRLVAAFDHRHIFLDPNPDAALSYAERRRMFELPRSSWADYRADLISPGGGVFERTLKSIPLSPEVKARLGINPAVEHLSPVELMRAILTAPVDLLWNGGIGTYVKASTETHLAVGDKANDALRVDGRDLRCLAVGEGGNLGFTQLGRVEYSTWGCEGTGGRINTDAIDNSAGVDTSDHEVNLKILLNAAVADGELTQPHRNELLMEVQDEVARLVLRHNYEQNVLLGVACAQSTPMLAVHRRLINALEAAGELDRELEYLPSEAVLEEREAVGGALTSPELSVLLAYSKTWLGKEIMASSLPEEDWYTQVLRNYFPGKVADRFEPRLQGHRLRRDIIVTEVVNDIVHRGGMTFVFRAMEETGAAVPEVARAFTVIREIFGFDRFWAQIEALDGKIPTSAQVTLYLDGRRLLDRAVRWLLNSRSSSIDVRAEIEAFRPHFEAMAPRVSELLVGYEEQRLQRRAGEFQEMGIPAGLALRGAGLLDTFSLLDVIEIAQAARKPVEVVGRLYFSLSDRFAVDILLSRIADLPRGNHWHNLARSALRYDLYSALAALAADVLATTPTATPEEQISAWEQNNAEGLARAERTLREVLAGDTPDLAVLSVALRSIRTLLRTG